MKRLWIDEKGIYRADFEGEEAIIDWFLEQDVQSSQAGCRSYIAGIEAVQRGEVKDWEGTGNAFTVSANGAIATITCEFADHQLTVPTDRLLSHLKDWLDHIASR